MLLERLVSGVKEFLSPQEPNTITELDLLGCLGRRVEVETETGEVYLLTIGKSAKMIDERLVDDVVVEIDSRDNFSAAIQRRLYVGKSMMYSHSIEEYLASKYVVIASIKRISVIY